MDALSDNDLINGYVDFFHPIKVKEGLVMVEVGVVVVVVLVVVDVIKVMV